MPSDSPLFPSSVSEELTDADAENLADLGVESESGWGSYSGSSSAGDVASSLGLTAEATAGWTSENWASAREGGNPNAADVPVESYNDGDWAPLEGDATAESDWQPLEYQTDNVQDITDVVETAPSDDSSEGTSDQSGAGGRGGGGEAGGGPVGHGFEPALETETLAAPEPEPVVEPVAAIPADPVPEPVVATVPEPTPEPTAVTPVETIPEPVVVTTPEPVVVTTPEPEPVVEPVAAAPADPGPEPVVATPPEPVSEPNPLLTDLVSAHEDAGGHTEEKHVEKDLDYLRDRCAEDDISRASSYTDHVTANECVSTLIEDNREGIDQWLSKGEQSRLRLEGTFPDNIGYSVSRDAGPNIIDGCQSARAILVKDSAMSDGYKILTSYPER